MTNFGQKLFFFFFSYLGIWRVVLPVKDKNEHFTLYRIATNRLGCKKLMKIPGDWGKYYDIEEEQKYKISGSVLR